MLWGSLVFISNRLSHKLIDLESRVLSTLLQSLSRVWKSTYKLAFNNTMLVHHFIKIYVHQKYLEQFQFKIVENLSKPAVTHIDGFVVPRSSSRPVKPVLSRKKTFLENLSTSPVDKNFFSQCARPSKRSFFFSR